MEVAAYLFFQCIYSGEAFHRLGFRVPKFQLSLVLYLSQVCLWHLSKVPDSQSSHGLHLCPVAILDYELKLLKM
jgi:hypothetical protein